MQLYNTLTRQVEPFAPADGATVRMYTCGPTVYNPAHLGNFRTFLFEDLMRRVLALRGWKVHQVMNLTDVDDKIIKRAHEQGKTITRGHRARDRDLSSRSRVSAHPAGGGVSEGDRLHPADDRARRAADRARRRVSGGRSLGVLRHREVSRLRPALAARHARDQGGRARHPGRLQQGERAGLRALEGGEAGGRGRRAPRGIPRGDAAGPAGTSNARRWRWTCWARRSICTAGGIDLIFPHHEDEIAQSEAATGVPFSRVWCHGAFLLTDGAKMAKRVGNVASVQALREERFLGGGAAAFRVQHALSEGAQLSRTTRSRRRVRRCVAWATSPTGSTRGPRSRSAALQSWPRRLTTR